MSTQKTTPNPPTPKSSSGSKDALLDYANSAAKLMKDELGALDAEAEVGEGLLSGMELEVPSELTKAMKEPGSGRVAISESEMGLRQALATSKSGYAKAKAAALSDLHGVQEDWILAKSTYEATVENALVAFKGAIDSASKDHIDPKGHPSPSTRQDHFYTMMQEATTALQTFEGTRKSAGTALMAALGALQEAYGAYRGATLAAMSSKLNSDAGANQTFWDSVKGVLTK